MCGIVSLISKYSNGFSWKESNVFKNMLFLDTIRGKDSTGVFAGNKYNNILIHKAALNGLDFINTKEYEDFDRQIVKEGMFAVGHNRAATRGTVNDQNAHPFWVDDNIVLVQNGTWNGDHKKVKDTEVDTEVIAHLLNEEKDIPTALKKVDAAFALSWYDVRTRHLHFIRNYQRPLWRAELLSGAIAFCSEPETIIWAVGREDMKLREDPKEVAPHTLVSFHMKHSGDHEETSLKLDLFRYSSSATDNYKNSPFWKQRQSSLNDDCGDDDWENCEGYEGWLRRHNSGVYAPPSQPTHTQQPGTGQPMVTVAQERVTGPMTEIRGNVGPNQIDHVFSEWIMKKGKEFHSGEHLAKKHGEVMMTGKDHEILVSLEDYFPGNKHKECQVWFVYGRAAAPGITDVSPCPIIYWAFHGTEDEVQEAVCETNLYMVTLGSPQIQSFLNDDNNRVAFCYSYGLGAKALTETLEETTEKKDEKVVH